MTITIDLPRMKAVADRLAFIAAGCALSEYALVDAYFGLLCAGLAGLLAGFAFAAVVLEVDRQRGGSI